MIIPTAEPFYFPGNNIGCLLIHGFTGAPKEMRWMGEYLRNLGYTVLGIRLAGHATQTEDMYRVTWRDWVASVEDGYCLLKGCVDKIFIIGLSMGGILSLLFASQNPVTGVVAMSTPFALPDDPRLPFIRIFAKLMPKMKKGPADWHNLAAASDHVDYPYIPTPAIIQLRDLLAEMRSGLPSLKVPALIIHSKQDRGVSPHNAEQIIAALGSQDKQILWVENSGHVIPREPDRQIAFEATHEFIHRVLLTNQPP
ncbi:MAG TPA: alpha/beta fold hydrolase [Anaerolineales bacterium]|nr:alpha/beta fold hydrolase [Anaerolineales bacterium]